VKTLTVVFATRKETLLPKRIDVSLGVETNVENNGRAFIKCASDHNGLANTQEL